MKIKLRAQRPSQAFRRNARLPQLNKATRLMRRFWGPSEMILAAMRSDNRRSQLQTERISA